jgi:hypothetical protein
MWTQSDAGTWRSRTPRDAQWGLRSSGWTSQCEAGDYAACDQLYSDSPPDSDYEYYGSTCGGTVDDELAGTCEHYYSGH